MEDWTKLTAKERIKAMISNHIEIYGKIPTRLSVSKKLIADLSLEDLIRVENVERIETKHPSPHLTIRDHFTEQNIYYKVHDIKLIPIN